MAAVSAHPVTGKTPAPGRPSARSNSLRHAASAVFAVTTILPLLIFVLTLHRLGALTHLQSQVGLGLALGVALFGFYIFRRLMGQMSDLISAVGRVVAQGARAPAEPRAAAAPAVAPAPTVAPAAARRVVDDRSPVPPAVAHPTPAPTAPSELRVAPPADESTAARVPGLGAIQEVDDLSQAMAKLWMGEAIPYKGRRVSLSVMNARGSIVGTLVDVTREGLLIEQDGAGQVEVSYGRLSGIDAA